jgi:hypothetical protein
MSRPKRNEYVAHATNHKLTPEFAGLVERRTLPFLNRRGMDMPLTRLLGEAYLQGMADAVAVLTTPPSKPEAQEQ